MLQAEGAVLSQKYEKQKVIQDLLNLPNSTHIKPKTRNKDTVSQAKVQVKKKSSPQRSRHFVTRMSRSCRQD